MSLGPKAALSIGRARITDVDGNPISIDEMTLSQTTIDMSHHEIHEGNHYFVADAFTLDDTDTVEILIIVPDTDIVPHLAVVTNSTSELSIDLYENSDRVGGSPVITPYNNNRNSLNISGLVIHGSITGGTTDGTIITHFRIGKAGTTPSRGDVGGRG